MSDVRERKKRARKSVLIPWEVRKEHRWSYAVMMLRTLEKRRAGEDVADDMAMRLDRWLAERAGDGTVVHYEPETEFGFHYVPRRPGLDADLIRSPDAS